MANRWHILATLSLARASMGFQFQTVAATAPLLSDQLGFDSAQIGWLIGLYLLPGVIVALPGGMLGARFGDKRVVIAGLAMMVIGGLGFGVSESIVGASIARVVMGVGAVAMNVLVFKMMTDWFAGKEMVLASSVLVNTWPIGVGLALLVQGAIALAVSWQMAFVVTAVLAAAGMLVVAIGFSPAADAPAAQRVNLASIKRKDWLILVLASLPWMLYNAPYVLLVAFLPTYLVQSGHSVVAAGGLTAVNTVLAIVSVLAGGFLVQRYGHPDGLAHLSLAGLAATLIGLLVSHEPLPWIVASGLIAGLPAGIFVSLPGGVLRAEARASGMGIFYTIFYAGTALAPVAGGAIAAHTGSSAAPLWMAVALVVLCSAALAAFRTFQRSDRPTQP